MNVTLSLDDHLVKKVRKIAVDRDTTLTGLIRSYLEQLAAEESASARKRRELEALERSFRELQFSMGKHTWTRAELHERS
jgi:predicted transcriptional regulator